MSNRIRGVVRSIAGDTAEVEVAHGKLRCRAGEGIAGSGPVSVFMRPESLRLSRRQHTERAWQGRVEFSIYHGDSWDYHVRVGEEILKVRVYREKVGLSRGDTVYLMPDEESVIVMPSANATGQEASQLEEAMPEDSPRAAL
ncbi:MAG: TOBE domain-containing protein, partial [Actinobacteria bacterium]|nr:TOBE domain-containing protein [Actinomycetota bacterium]